MGYISDRSNLRTAFLAASVAVALSAVILFYGMRFAPAVAVRTVFTAGKN